MPSVLACHPETPCSVIGGIEVVAARPQAGRLELRYRLSSVTEALVLPAMASGRTDELWKHTCLEAFVQPAGEAGYRELNLSPGGAWAAYRFDRYREGMAAAQVGSPHMRVGGREGGDIDILAVWDLDLDPDAAWRVGVSAVIEAADGSRSYWALAHAPGRPDFHDADGFTLELPAPPKS
jgi:hypothetical protein